MLELLIDFVLLVHIPVSFLSAFYRDVNLVADFPYIAVAYLQSYFLIDCLSTIPGVVVLEQGPTAESLYYFKFLRLLKARHFLGTVLHGVRTMLTKYSTLTTRTITVINKFIRQAKSHLINRRLIVTTAILIHWLSCAFIYTSMVAGEDGKNHHSM